MVEFEFRFCSGMQSLPMVHYFASDRPSAPSASLHTSSLPGALVLFNI